MGSIGPCPLRSALDHMTTSGREFSTWSLTAVGRSGPKSESILTRAGRKGNRGACFSPRLQRVKEPSVVTPPVFHSAWLLEPLCTRRHAKCRTASPPHARWMMPTQAALPSSTRSRCSSARRVLPPSSTSRPRRCSPRAAARLRSRVAWSGSHCRVTTRRSSTMLSPSSRRISKPTSTTSLQRKKKLSTRGMNTAT